MWRGGESSPGHSDRVAPRFHISRVAPKRNAAHIARGSPYGRARPPQSQLVIGLLPKPLGSANERPRSPKTDLSFSYCLSRNVVKTSRATGTHLLWLWLERCNSAMHLSCLVVRRNPPSQLRDHACVRAPTHRGLSPLTQVPNSAFALRSGADCPSLKLQPTHQTPHT